MPDWRSMYIHLFRETERAIDILTNAQRKCEDMYINAPEPKIRLFPQSGAPEEEVKKIPGLDKTSPEGYNEDNF